VAWGNCLVVVPVGKTLEVGDVVSVVLL